MVERANRRDLIIEEAARLFVEQGYAATSVRQIAEAVGCTEAALYYHFKDGKRELLQEVVSFVIPDLVTVVEECQAAQTLHEFVMLFAQGMATRARQHMVTKLRWLAGEFPKLGREERALLNEKHRVFREKLVEQLQRFVPDESDAKQLAWLLVFTLFGYGQLMLNLEMAMFEVFDLDAFIKFLAKQIAAGYE